jgi:uroporphyrin-III C-methyltransferase
MSFAALDAVDFPEFEPATVWLVGAGPGAPGLLSLLGYHALQQAEIIVYDALVGEGLLKLAGPAAEQIYAGKRVLRLKGGDPFMFGRGGEEAAALARAGVRFRIVPGISAGLGGLAYAGIPVTHRDTNHAVIFLTGHDETGDLPQSVDWAAIANAAPVIVMFMAVKHLAAIAEKLLAAGRDPADRLAVVSHAAMPWQKVMESTLGEAPSLTGLETPAIVVLGPVSAYRELLDWYAPDLRGNPIG